MFCMQSTKQPHVPSLAALVEEYRTNGFIVLRSVFTPHEIALWQEESDRLLKCDWVKPENVRTPFRLGSGNAPERIDPVVDVSPLFQNLVQDPRIIDVVRALFEEAPLLFKDKLIFKAPGTEGYKPHQDQAWWHLCPPNDILSVSIQIDGASQANGCIELLAECHDQLVSPAGEFRNLRPDEVAFLERKSAWQAVETIPGDVLIFHSLAPHRSGKNTASVSRRSLYLTYSSAKHGNLYQQYLDAYVARLLGEKSGGAQFFQ